MRHVESLVLATSLILSTSGFAQYRVVVLPTWSGGGSALSVDGDLTVGYSNVYPANVRGGPILWSLANSTYVRLPAGNFELTFFEHIRNGLVVGTGYGAERNTAILHRLGTRDVIDLDPNGWSPSWGYATDGFSQVGVGNSVWYQHALLWHGTPESKVDLHPGQEYAFSNAYDVWGDIQVGSVAWERPVIWHGTAASMRYLRVPKGAQGGAATGIHGNQIIGAAWGVGAVIWDATTLECTVLGLGSLTATNGIQQVGSVGERYAYNRRATVWSGSPETRMDLHQFLPRYLTGVAYPDSIATGINGDGVIVGYAYFSLFSSVPVAWIPDK